MTERAQDGLLRDLIHVRNSLQQLRHLLSSLQEASGLEDVEFDVDTEESCAELDDDMRDRVVDEFLQSNLSEWIIGHSHLVEKLLREMILRCTDSRNDDALTREGAPNLRYQNVLREQGCFELLMSLLEALIERKRLPLWILEEPEAAPVLKIGQLVYRLCKQVCKGNATNAAALSRWIPSMQQHLLTEMKCEDTLTEMRVSPPRRGIAHGLHGLRGAYLGICQRSGAQAQTGGTSSAAHRRASRAAQSKQLATHTDATACRRYAGHYELLNTVSNDVILTFLKLLAKVKKPRLIDFLAGLCVCLRSVRLTADVGGATERLKPLPCASKFATVPSCTFQPHASARYRSCAAYGHAQQSTTTITPPGPLARAPLCAQETHEKKC